MISKKTVFVLGAGASAPYGFPTGIELREKIIKKQHAVISDLNVRDTFTVTPEGVSKCLNKFAFEFKNASVNSIDRFLNEQEKNYIEFGKVVIMAVIRSCEKRSHFNEDIKDVNLDWYRLLFNKLVEGVNTFDNFTFDNVEIITFNYDRSLEFYLYKSLRNLYPLRKINDEKIINLMRTLKIHHVFGKVENLIWENNALHFTEEKVEDIYRNSYWEYLDLFKKINSIKIINEVEKEGKNYKGIIESAEDVFFLGFGYLEENMKILGAPFEKKSSVKTRYLGTAYGAYEKEIEKIHNNYFANACSGNFIENCDCVSLLRLFLK